MNPIIIGKFIALKRKQKNLTQEQLAQHLNISNKTISKWETGKSMPDYSLIKPLCKELDITISELIEGEELNHINEEQILDLLRRTQELEKQKNLLYGIVIIVLGIALQALSYTVGGTGFKDFFSGVLVGISIGDLLGGVYIIGKTITK